MAKSKSVESASVASPVAPSKSAEEIYNDHNHETAQKQSPRMQCQCDTCKAYRGDKD